MTYVLIYTDSENHPEYIQGSIEKINDELKTRCLSGEIEHADWDYYQKWKLLAIEDGRLTPVNTVECHITPYLEVY